MATNAQRNLEFAVTTDDPELALTAAVAGLAYSLLAVHDVLMRLAFGDSARVARETLSDARLAMCQNRERPVVAVGTVAAWLDAIEDALNDHVQPLS